MATTAAQSAPARPKRVRPVALSLRHLRQGEAGARRHPARCGAAELDRPHQGRPSRTSGRGAYLRRGPRPLPLTLCFRAARAGARRTHQARAGRGAEPRRSRDAGGKHRSGVGRPPDLGRKAVGSSGELRRQLDLYYHFLCRLDRLDGLQRRHNRTGTRSTPIPTSCSISFCHVWRPFRRRSS